MLYGYISINNIALACEDFLFTAQMYFQNQSLQNNLIGDNSQVLEKYRNKFHELINFRNTLRKNYSRVKYLCIFFFYNIIR